MKRIFTGYLSFIFMIGMNFIPSKQVFSNAAQPGVWNAGGTVFTMLYPEDSVVFRKVQMQYEKIYIQLYKGFAVVKGVYTFRNTGNDTLRFKMGYPVNGIYYGGNTDLNNIHIDSLSKFKVKVNGVWATLFSEPNNNGYIHSGKNIINSNNWMVWEMVFQPKEVQTTEVLFIVNTNNATIRKGYSTDKKNAFIYLLESGSVWFPPIERGDFYIQLMQGLQQKDVSGISDGFNMKYNEAHRLYAGEKNNFLPTNRDNLVVSYSKRIPDFDFNAVSEQSEVYFSAIERMTDLASESLLYHSVQTGDPYAVKSSTGLFVSAIFILITIVLPLTGILIIVWIVRSIIKKKKNKVSLN